MWDRSFDLRFDLLKERKYLPTITAGFQDVIGTGLYSAEYLVASKNLFNTLDASLGLGWGRLASQNIVSKGGVRPHGTGGALGGKFRTDQLFKGNVGLFGGIKYNTPIKPFSFKAELSSDNYNWGSGYYTRMPQYKINYGLDYNLNDSVNLSTYYVRGSEVGLQLNLTLNPKRNHTSKFLEASPEPFYSIPLPYNNKKEYWKNIEENLRDEKIILTAHKEIENKVIVFINNYHFPRILKP